MEVVVQTRFSYLGKGGWKAKESVDPALLFDEDRLNLRFMLFEEVTLPSLAAQTDDDFKFHVLSSDQLPKPHKERLVDVCQAVLGKERVTVKFEGYGMAGRYFRKYIWKNYTFKDAIAQTVLDDDDAFAGRFVHFCRKASTEYYESFTETNQYVVLSFPSGYQYFVGAPLGEQFIFHRERYINLGLTWVSHGKTKKNALLTRHKVVNRVHPVGTAFGQTPLYLRTLHGLNDSRVPNKDSTKHAVSFVENKFVRKGFKFMTDEHLAFIQKNFFELNAKVDDQLKAFK